MILRLLTKTGTWTGFEQGISEIQPTKRPLDLVPES